MTEPQHGTVTRYKYRGCRCRLCKSANADYQLTYNRARGVRPVSEVSAARRKPGHGHRAAYQRGCRCDECVRWAREDRRRLRVNGNGVTCPDCGGVLAGEQGLRSHRGKMHRAGVSSKKADGS